MSEKPPSGKDTAPADAEGDLQIDIDAHQIVECMKRVKDPMTRYLLCMMIDRLTHQIAAMASTGENQRAHILKAIDLN